MLDLSPQQKSAVHYIKGPLLILGGAGAGKTSVLAHKIAWLVRECDTPPTNILAISATANAARALRLRVAGRIGHQVPNLNIGIFSEISLTLIQQRLETLDLRPGFSLYDRTDSEAVISRILHEARPSLIRLAPAVTRQISQWKRCLVIPRQSDPRGTSVADVAAWLYPLYERRLQTVNALDLDDLPRKALALLTSDAELRQEWRDRFRFLLVDEYERSTHAEHEIVRNLLDQHLQLTATGDEHQATGEDPRYPEGNIGRLRVEIDGIRVVRLEHNFRSNIRIARAATALARPRRITEASLSRALNASQRLAVLQTRNEQHEAETIVGLLLDHRRRRDTDYRDVAVLFPRLEMTGSIERALSGHRIPYYIRGGASFFDQVEVRDLWSYLRLLCNPADDTAFLRAINTPRRDIDRTTLEQLLQFAASRGRPLLECALSPELERTLDAERFASLHDVAVLLQYFSARAENTDPVQLTHDLIEVLRYDEWLRDTCNDAKIAEDRMQNVLALIARLRRLTKQHPGIGLRSLIARLALTAFLEPDGNDTMTEGVVLMPVAAAKGFEFTHVYVIGFEEGLLPAADSEFDILSERRRAYTAISCARESVTFTLTESRRFAGDVSPRRPSRFLAELPSEDLEWRSTPQEAVRAELTLGHVANRYSPAVLRNFR